MQFKSRLVEGNIVEKHACYSLGRIETLQVEKLCAYLNFNARWVHYR